jgi:hypothetical protein
MSRPNGHGDKDRDVIVQCIADAFQTLDVISRRGPERSLPSLARRETVGATSPTCKCLRKRPRP